MSKLFQPEQLELSNGIPVILQHYDGPVAATYWWVKTGSTDEAAPEAGFAHFLEHMHFKDAAAKETGTASTGKMARTIESLGGDINAYTSFDQTVYHVTCAAHHWERVLDAFGSMAKPQHFLKEDFEREREVILEELRKNEDSPNRAMFQTLFSATFKKHPYGRPVIGYTKTLKAAKVANLEAFYKRNYVSGKMGLVLVGPVEDARGTRKKTILRYLEKHFGAKVLRKKDCLPKPRPVEPERRPSANVVLRSFDVKTPSLSFAFRVPDLMHEDMPALDLLGGILGMGELSRLYQELFYKKSLVTDVSGGAYVPHDPGMLYFSAEVDSVEKIEPVARALFEELARIATEGPTKEELARVLVNAESERLYSTQTADGMAGRLGFLKFILGDLDFDQVYLEQLRAVDEARIREAAKYYLDYRRMSGVILVPKENKAFDVASISELARKILSPAEEAEKEVPLKKKKPAATGDMPVEFLTLPSGLKVAYFERPQSHVFSAHAGVLGGLRLELTHPIDSPEKDWGASHMMALTWTKGTPTRDARAIAAVAEGHAAGIEGFSGRNTVGLQMTGLARDWGTLSELFTSVLLEPTFPEAETEHSRRVVEDSIRGIEDHTSQLCSKLFLETLFERHPYGKLSLGSLESIHAIDQKKLSGFHRQWVRPERLVISVSGAVKRSSLDLWLAELDRKAIALGKLAPAMEFPARLEDEPELKAPRWVEKTLGREQTHILVGGLGTTITSDDRHALRILQNVLGGQSGRLFIELREKKSLAYTVAPLSFEGMERGYVGTYIACAPAKKDEALAGIREVLERLALKGPTDAEMRRAQEFYLGRRAMDLQSDSALASHEGLELLYGVPHLSEPELVRKIRGISSKEIQRVCAKYLVEPHRVTSVVG